jgi:tetratricopeptide (TPR) repeat protein
MRRIPMEQTRSLVAVGMLAGLVVFAAGCNKLKARDNLNQGVNAFRAGKYTDAADSFKTAIDLDPELPAARLYLATAYMSQYVPGSDTPENKRNADSALSEFDKVLQTDSKNLLATQSVANLYYQMKNLPKAQEWEKKVIELDPKNKEAFYTLGVIAWTQFVPADREARAAMDMSPESPGPLKSIKAAKGKTDPKADLKEKYWQSLTDGIDSEKKALDVDPEYENAMAYMNLLIRFRADLLDTKDEWAAASKEADGWVQKNLDTTKIKAQRKAAKAEQTQ